MHLNRLIIKYELNVIFLAGPGQGAPALISNVYLEGTYSEIYSDVSEDTDGLQRLFKQFSFPGGIGSHCTPETPGSIHEGGELGYSVSHAFGVAFDNPDLIVTVMVGDGESETGASMHQAMAATLEHCIREIRRIQQEARRSHSEVKRPRWPMVTVANWRLTAGPWRCSANTHWRAGSKATC